MKGFKKIITVLFSICILANLTTANVHATSLRQGVYWVLDKIESNYSTTTSGSWTLFYSGAPAAKAGEYDTVGYSVTYSHSASASFSATLIKDQVEAQLGLTIGKDVTFSGAKNSAQLSKGEYVKAYYIKQYKVHKVTEAQVFGSSSVKPTPESERRIVYVNEAILPQIKLEYYGGTSKSLLSNSISTLEEAYKTEYYNYINGEYILTNTEYR
jgi:hypothetical protein